MYRLSHCTIEFLIILEIGVMTVSIRVLNFSFGMEVVYMIVLEYRIF